MGPLRVFASAPVVYMMFSVPLYLQIVIEWLLRLRKISGPKYVLIPKYVSNLSIQKGVQHGSIEMGIPGKSHVLFLINS